MLLSFILPLRPETQAELPANLHQATHAWFLDRVRALDHHLEARLHQAHVEKPFTISNLLTLQPPRQNLLYLSPQDITGIRITSYDPELSAFLEQKFIPTLPERVFLQQTPFGREEVITRPQQTKVRAWQPWVGRDAFEALWAQVQRKEELPETFRLHFASPTVFRSQGQLLPLPLPRLIFEGLARRWNQYAPILHIHPGVRAFSEQALTPDSFRLHTEVVRYREGKRGAGRFSGFVGTCTFRFTRPERYWQEMILVLAAFARYAGVGRNTARGMGQCRLMA